VLSLTFYSVRENEYACTVRFSKIISTVDTAGLHMKIPFIDTVRIFPNRPCSMTSPRPRCFTSDKQNMTVDSFCAVEHQRPAFVLPVVGSITVAEERLDAVTYNALKDVMGTLAQSDIINMEDAAARNQIYSNITGLVQNLAKNYGIHIIDVKIKRFDLPSANEQAVYSRMISERNQMAEKYTADGEYEASIIRNNVDKQVNILLSHAKAKAAALEAEGEAEYMRRLAEAYNTEDKQNFYRFMQALEALKPSLGGSEKTVILGADSELAKILANP
jgi:membrane protease subunit HflC